MRLGDKIWALRFREGQVLAYLALAEGTCVHWQDMAEAILGPLYHYSAPQTQMAKYICDLRRKLAGTSYEIVTKRKVGWMLVRESC